MMEIAGLYIVDKESGYYQKIKTIDTTYIKTLFTTEDTEVTERSKSN